MLRNFSNQILRPAACLAALAFLVAIPSALHADVTIDNFTTPQNLNSGVGVGAFGPISSTVGAAATGGFRTMTLSRNAFALQSVNFSVGGGSATLSSGSFSTSTGSLTYNGNGAGLGAALAGTTGVSVSLAGFNPGNGNSTISVTITDASLNSSTQSIILNNATPVPSNLFFNFAGSGLNFNNITSVVVTVNSSGSIGTDFILQNLIAVMTPVPEPLSLAIWSSMGVLGFVFARRSGLIRK